MRPLGIAFIVSVTFLAAPPALRAAEPDDYESAHFLLHTDLSADEAKAQLDRLEEMLGLLVSYWGRPAKGTIECYLVDDLRSWPLERVPIPDLGLAKIRAESGRTVSQGWSTGKVKSYKSVVYAANKKNVVQHEAVHAYCMQTFGAKGPDWYAEGMAEVAQYWRPDDQAVHCDRWIVKYLRAEEPRPFAELVNPKAAVDTPEEYAWRWSLCHVLSSTPAYKDRFRALGADFLAGRKPSFRKLFGAVQDEIEFEHRFFLKHFDAGYRVDLCAWDWKAKFAPLRPGQQVEVAIDAQRGWQPSGVTCSAGSSYSCACTGEWAIGADATMRSADGDKEGRGRLEGVLLDRFELSEPFELGATATFKAPQDGKLFLRCRDEWNRLADNRGRVTVTIAPATTP